MTVINKSDTPLTARSLGAATNIKTTTATNSGVSTNGTKWTQFGNGNVDLVFKDGNTSSINPTALGLTLDAAISSFEKQFQTLNETMILTDQDYMDLIEDFIGTEMPSESSESNTFGYAKPGRGLTNGLAQLPIFMSFSEKGLQDLTSLMGYFPLPILNSLNQWVVGFQHVIDPSELDLFNSFPTSIEAAKELLMGDILGTFTPLLQNLIRVPLTQQQFDSLIGSVATMGPTRFADSGIAPAVNGGDFGGAADIRECYNATNGEFDPAKGFAANTQSLGIQNQTDQSGFGSIADPGTIGSTQPGGRPGLPNSPIYTPPNPRPTPTTPPPAINPIIDGINKAAKTATTMSPVDMAAILYGFAHHETRLGNEMPTNGAGLFNYLKANWLADVEKYGASVAGLETLAAQLKLNPTVAIKQQVNKFRENHLIAGKVLVKSIELYLIPTLRTSNYVVTPGSIWNIYHSPGTLSTDIPNKFNWSSIAMGSKYAAKYFK